MKKYFFVLCLLGISQVISSEKEIKLDVMIQWQISEKEALRKAANRYIEILNHIGAPQSGCRTEEITSSCARNCKKVRNGEILFEERDQFPLQLEAGKSWLGSWSIDVKGLLIAADDRAAAIRYELSTEKEGNLIVFVLLYFDSNYLITEINEVHNKLEF